MNAFTVLGQNEPSVKDIDQARGWTIEQQLPGEDGDFIFFTLFSPISLPFKGQWTFSLG
jgi:hypothetical protein